MNELDWPVDGSLHLSYRALGRLRYAKIVTVGELVACSELDLLDVPRLGPSILTEIKTALSIHGLELREES